MLDAGRLIFENLAVEARPPWAARVLQVVLDRTGVKSQLFDRAISMANNPHDWSKAHDLFSALRDATLELDQVRLRTPRQTTLLRHLLLAELVAKVTYNATNPPDEFDEDSGWYIAQSMRDILDSLNDEEFSTVAWSSLSGDV